MQQSQLPTIKRVKLEGRIGRGGMADVFLGVHKSLGHRVAVKVLHAHLLEQEELRRRFHDEAKAIATLRHPNIVQVYDFDLVDGRPYIIMELLGGPSLAQHLAALGENGRRLPLDHAVGLLTAVADALDYAHAKGIVHRDVKPANVVLRGGRGDFAAGSPLPDDIDAVLTDFGIARVASATSATATGTLLGTPAYMAPEQVLGEGVSPRTDIYSLGVVLYELLSGELPFPVDGDSPAAVLFKHVHDEPAPLRGYRASVQRVVDRSLAKDPADRYLTARDLTSDLKRALAGGHPEPITMHSSAKKSRQVRPSEPENQPRLGMLLGGGAIAFALVSLIGLFGPWSPLWPGDFNPGGGVEGAEVSPTAAVSATAQDESTDVALAAGEQSTSAVQTGSTTATSQPTNSATPTSTAPATDTPSPATDTPSPAPTATQPPTATPTPLPSATPSPTSEPTTTPIIDLEDPIDDLS